MRPQVLWVDDLDYGGGGLNKSVISPYGLIFRESSNLVVLVFRGWPLSWMGTEDRLLRQGPQRGEEPGQKSGSRSLSLCPLPPRVLQEVTGEGNRGYFPEGHRRRTGAQQGLVGPLASMRPS